MEDIGSGAILEMGVVWLSATRERTRTARSGLTELKSVVVLMR